MRHKYFWDCEGCEWEFQEAIYCQDVEGLFFATSIDDYMELEDMEHFSICMVDDAGRIIEW